MLLLNYTANLFLPGPPGASPAARRKSAPRRGWRRIPFVLIYFARADRAFPADFSPLRVLSVIIINKRLLKSNKREEATACGHDSIHSADQTWARASPTRTIACPPPPLAPSPEIPEEGSADGIDFHFIIHAIMSHYPMRKGSEKVPEERFLIKNWTVTHKLVRSYLSYINIWYTCSFSEELQHTCI